MLPSFPVGSLPPRPAMSGAAAAERGSPLERAVATEPVTAADRETPFSRAAEAQRVPPAATDALLEQLPVGVMLVDRDARVVYANAAARTLRAERLESLQWAVTRALLTEDPVREDAMEVAVPGQTRRRLSAHVMPVRVDGLGVNTAFVTITDVTARDLMKAWTPVIETLVNL